MKVNWKKITDTAFQTEIPNTNYLGFFIKLEEFNKLVTMTTNDGKVVWVHKDYSE